MIRPAQVHHVPASAVAGTAMEASNTAELTPSAAVQTDAQNQRQLFQQPAERLSHNEGRPAAVKRCNGVQRKGSALEGRGRVWVGWKADGEREEKGAKT